LGSVRLGFRDVNCLGTVSVNYSDREQKQDQTYECGQDFRSVSDCGVEFVRYKASI